MAGKRWGVLSLIVLLGGLLTAGPSWGQESAGYNGKMSALMQYYFKIQESLAHDSLEGVPENGHLLVKQAQEIRILVADRMPRGAKLKLQQIKKSAGGLGSKDIQVVRNNFQSLSGVLIEFLEMVGLPDSLRTSSFYVFYCPQADGRWMQGDTNIRNPFYGKLMLKSGQLEGKLQSRVTAAYNGL